MNKRIITGICIVSLLFSLSIYCSAHSGKTDGNGGHTDRSTGEYHYHHGYPAHQHTNGICPYNFDDNTSSQSSSTKNVLDKSDINNTTDDPESTWDYIKFIILCLFVSLVPTLFFVYFIYGLYELITKKYMTDRAALIISIIIYIAIVIFCFNLRF